MAESRDILLVYPRCGKYDLFILDMPLGLLYIARLLEAAGHRVHIFDQRVDPPARLDELLTRDPLWVGISIMTGEPIRHALELADHIRARSRAPLVWGGIHPTILPDQTLADDRVDYVVRGKGERSALRLTEHLLGLRPVEEVPGLSRLRDGVAVHNPEDCEEDWGEMPMVNYGLVNVERYGRVGFEKHIFSIMTSRNCPYKCTFCYNSSLGKAKPWAPDDLDYVKRHLAYIIETYRPEYLSFIDDDFFVDLPRARAILEHLATIMPPGMKTGFRGARVSDLLRLDDDFFRLLERVNTRHVNIGVESGSKRILTIIRKGMTPDMAVRCNRRLARYPFLIPLYNFFSGIPQETEEDIRLSTRLVLQLVRDNPGCQISGYHQYTPYPGNKLFDDATRAGFVPPSSLAEWGSRRFEDNALNCPWIDAKRRKLLDMIYSMIYFVDNKYETYLAPHNRLLRALTPLVRLYRPIARARLRHHFSALPIEVVAKNLIYRFLNKA